MEFNIQSGKEQIVKFTIVGNENGYFVRKKENLLKEFPEYLRMKEGIYMFEAMGQQAVLGIISHVFFIGVSFYALQALMIDKFIKKNHVFQAQVLYIFLSILIGTSVSNFFLTISGWSNQLPYLFQ